MRVIKDRQIVDDTWELIAADAPVPATGDVIISVAAWNAGQAGFAGRQGKVGVRLKSSESPEQIQALDSVPLIAIEFPSFTDGRGYSNAHLLRDRHAYQGELRAIGDVLRDQLFFMARCGIDSFALKAGKDIEGALAAFNDFSVTYQAAVDEKRPLFRRVHR